MIGFDILKEYLSSHFVFPLFENVISIFHSDSCEAFVIAFRVMKIEGIKKLSG
jgi:hypothetical protein